MRWWYSYITHKICNFSVRSGVLPERWNQVNIILLETKKATKNPSNHRYVSQLPLFGNILERIAYDELFRHVAQVLSKQQHIFLGIHAWCNTNFSVYLRDPAWEAMSDGYQTDLALLPKSLFLYPNLFQNSNISRPAEQGPSRSDELHESKLSFVSHIEFIR